jgi:hypothetical protein
MILAIFHCEFIGNSLTLSCILQLELSVLASGVLRKNSRNSRDKKDGNRGKEDDEIKIHRCERNIINDTRLHKNFEIISF